MLGRPAKGLSRQPPLDVLRETPPPAQEASPGMKGVRKRGRPAKGLSRQSPLDVLRETPPPAQEASPGMKGVRKRGRPAKVCYFRTS
uniref:HMGA1 protein n=1 Tax=Heterorhabditis bacteriophora TaxID=37862 RepID=A0A1I7WEC5_HETBA